MSYGGVDCIATGVCPDSGKKELLIEKIFRMPLNKYVLELPAGMQDAGETDAGLSAIRELKEETGYEGTVTSVSKVHRIDPWKSTERGCMVFMDVKVGVV